MTLDTKRPLQTVSGNPVIYLGTLPEPHDGNPLVVAVLFDGRWQAETYALDGSYMPDRSTGWDLVQAPRKRRAA